MHAISREGCGEDFSRPCIYIQLDDSKGLPAEVYFAPSAPDLLEASFRAFSQTALLNPPLEDADGGMLAGEDGFEGFYGEVDSELIGSSVGDDDDDGAEYDADPTSEEGRTAMLAHLDSILQVPPSLVVHGALSEGLFKEVDAMEAYEVSGP